MGKALLGLKRHGAIFWHNNISSKGKIKNLTRRKRPVELKTVVKEINPILRGGGNYFKKSHYFLPAGIENNGKKAGGFYILDFWVMWRVRNFIAKK